MKPNLFSKNLYLDRYSLGLSQADISRAINISQQAIARWENGHSIPKYEVFEKLKNFLRNEFQKTGGESLVCSTVLNHLPKQKEIKPQIELLDYFASKAMQGLMHNYHPTEFLENKNYLEDIAMASYFMAKAMIKAREDDEKN